jgi:tight adherence protein B
MQSALLILIYLLAFVAMVVGVQSAAGFIFSSRDKNERTNRRLTMLASGMTHSEVYAALVRQPLTSPSQNARVSRLYEQLVRYYRQAGLEGSPMRALSLIGLASIALWLASFLFLRGGNLSGYVLNAVVAAPASLLICSLVFWVWLSRKRAKRMKQLEEQMPLALDVINRALRAGHPVVSAVRLAGEEMGDPIGSEFGLVVDETTYGYEFRDALVNFARRTGSPDAHFFAVSIGVQSETGGNLAEILEGLATVIRGRTMLSKKVKALSSEGRASALLLSVLPALLIGFMLVFQPAYYTSKFSDPIFWPTAGCVFLLYLVGIYLIRRIINFKY